jgi:hypothetical protein
MPAGVLVAAGTDFGGGSLRANQLAWEVETLVAAGLPPYDALAAATVNGGRLLGEPGAGVLEAGRPGRLPARPRRPAGRPGGPVAGVAHKLVTGVADRTRSWMPCSSADWADLATRARS